MTRRSDFTDQEWHALERGVTGTALVLAAAEGGPLSAIKEARALAQHLDEARRTSGSALVHDLIASMTPALRAMGSVDDVERDTLAALRVAVATLEAKAPDELPPYRTLVRGVAAAVAGAAGSPTRLERAALRLVDADSADEADTLARIQAALGEPPDR
jgi:hypothetical protein